MHTLRTTLNIHDETKVRLVKVRGEMERKNGKGRSLEEVLNELIDYFEMHEK